MINSMYVVPVNPAPEEPGSIPLSPEGGFKGFGNLGLTGGAGEAPTIFNAFISGVIGFLTIIAIIWLIFLLITGAYGVMSAGGDKAALETARKRLTTAIVGFVIVVAAIFIIRLIGELLGLENILNPTLLLENMLNSLGL
jgi:hypothetical protein